MQTIDKRNDDSIRFESLTVGDVFEYDGEFFMVILLTDNGENVINLRTGELLTFDDSDWVYFLPNAKLVIE